MSTALSKKELADAAGKSYRWLHEIDTKQPSDKKLFVKSEDVKGKYDLGAFVKRWVEYNLEAAGIEDINLTQVKAQHELVKKEKTQLEVSRMKGEYVETAEVDRMWRNVAGIVRNSLMNMGKKLAPRITMCKDADEIEEVIDREVREALIMIANTPLPSENYESEQESEEAEE